MQGIESKGLLVLAWVFLLVVLLPTLALGAARFEPAPAAGATLRGLYALSQSVNGTNAPDSPAQLLTLSDTTGEFQVVGPVIDAQGNPLWFSSVTGWPFYSGGAAVGGRTYSVLQRPDGTPVLATIDLATGKAIETLALKDMGAIFGLFMIAAVDGEPYGAVLRYVRQSSFIDVGPILANGSVARQVSFKHFVLVSRVISGGKYFGFLRDDVGHELVDVAKGTVVDVLGRNCWYNNQWINVAPGIMRGPAGFVQPSTGAPFALISRKPVDGQGSGFMLSLARLNDSSAPGTTRYCQIEWLVDIAPLDGHGLAQSAYDPTTDQFHVLVGKTGPSWSFTLTSLVTIDINARSVRQVDLSWPNAFRGGIRQLIYHV